MRAATARSWSCPTNLGAIPRCLPNDRKQGPVLGRATTRIINEVLGINRAVYDVTLKMPGTIEQK